MKKLDFKKLLRKSEEHPGIMVQRVYRNPNPKSLDDMWIKETIPLSEKVKRDEKRYKGLTKKYRR